MLNTLSIDMKILNIRDFPQKLHSLKVLYAEYSKNLGHSVQFFQKIGKFAILCTNIHKLNNLVGENSKKSGFSMNRKQIFTKYLQFYIWFYKGILDTTQKIIVALIYQINPVQITTITAENTKNLLNSVPHTIENIQFKIVKNAYLL